MLTVENLYVNYGNLQILHDVSLHIDEGELVSLVGANGAGKTTLLRTVSGLKMPVSGKVLFNNVDITFLDAPHTLGHGLVLIPEGRKLFDQLTVKENLELGSYSKRSKLRKKENLEYVFTMLPDLKIKEKEVAGNLSGGQQQMLAIGRGLMSDPQLLILDEPSIGLSPVLTDTMFDIIKKIKQDGVTILLVEQNVEYSLSIADRGYVLEQGRITMQGKAQDLLKDKNLKRAYLGL